LNLEIYRLVCRDSVARMEERLSIMRAAIRARRNRLDNGFMGRFA